MSAFTLITQEIADSTPAIGATGELEASEIIVRAKFFTPWSSWTWYMVEYDPETRVAFGFVTSNLCPEGELGSFSIAELEAIRGSIGVQVIGMQGSEELRTSGPVLRVERDLHYGHHTLREVLDHKRSAR